MRLFREGTRDSLKIIAPGQSSFDWLDNSAKPGAEKARQDLQALFDRLPEAIKPTMAKRIRSAGADHDAAIVEVYFHEVFRQCGYGICVEPTTLGGSCPEFLIQLGEFKAYVEVTTDMGAATVQKEDKAIHDLLSRVSERIETAGFGILVDEGQKGQGNPSPTRFAKFLDKWFRTFDHAAERAKWDSAGGDWSVMPTTVYAELETGWKIKMTLWPLASADKRIEFIAGTTGITSGWCNSEGRLTENIRAKIRQHAGSELPLVVCVAINDFMSEPDQEDVVSVLLGKGYSIYQPGSEVPAVHRREWDGLWAPRQEGRNTKFNNLVLVRRVYPWSLMDAKPELWDRPNVAASAVLPSWRFRRFRWNVPGDGELRELPATAETIANA